MGAAFIDRCTRICGSRMLVALLLINVAVFLLAWGAIIIGNAWGLPGNFTLPWLCVSADPLAVLYHPWTPITYMVTQYSFLHLLFNMLWLFWFGRLLQTTLSDRHLILLYVGGGLTGALFFMLATLAFSPSGAYLSGASASVLAIITACAFRTPDMRLMLFLFGEVKLKWIAIGCIVLTFAGVGGGNPGGQAAHIGGLLFAVAFSLLLKKGIDLSRHLPLHKDGAIRIRRKNVRRKPEALAKAVNGRLTDTDRLDQLLDKIRLSGYSSLSRGERQELNALSRKLNN